MIQTILLTNIFLTLCVIVVGILYTLFRVGIHASVFALIVLLTASDIIFILFERIHTP